jgi:hypothetical protein
VMILVLAHGLVGVKHPAMSIDPASLVGSVYYLCHDEEGVVRQCKGMALVNEKKRRERLDADTKYRFGELAGVDGRTRMVVFMNG